MFRFSGILVARSGFRNPEFGSPRTDGFGPGGATTLRWRECSLRFDDGGSGLSFIAATSHGTSRRTRIASEAEIAAPLHAKRRFDGCITIFQPRSAHDQDFARSISQTARKI
jgi:hypothetical protein